MKERLDKKSFIKYIVSVLLFGFNGIVASNISVSSYNIVFFRTLFGSLLLVSVFFIKGGKFNFRKNQHDIIYITLSGVAMGTSWMFLYEAYEQIGISLASILYYFGSVIVMMLSPIIFKEKFTLPKITGFIVVIVGIVLVNQRSATDGLSTFGIVCGFLSAITYFFMVTFNKKSKNISGIENSAIQLVASFITLAVFIGIKQHFVFHIPASDWPWLLLLGLFNTGFGCYLYFSSLKKLPAQTVALCGNLELFSAVIFAEIFLHEKLLLWQKVGAILIVLGTMIGELIKVRRNK